MQRAADYGSKYRDRRGSMVVDVVASRQRKYDTRVRSIVEDWQNTAVDHSLAGLEKHRPNQARLGLRHGEAETMILVAQGLAKYAHDHSLEEEDACRAWAESVALFEHAHRLDPYVGAVKGIGTALFAYIRMRCGADALKPDSRVWDALNKLGYELPKDPHAILVVARGAATELGTSLLVLDQVLW